MENNEKRGKERPNEVRTDYRPVILNTAVFHGRKNRDGRSFLYSLNRGGR